MMIATNPKTDERPTNEVSSVMDDAKRDRLTDSVWGEFARILEEKNPGIKWSVEK